MHIRLETVLVVYKRNVNSNYCPFLSPLYCSRDAYIILMQTETGNS